MLKEMTVLVIVLWGIQGMPTPPSQANLNLCQLYCEAESLLENYESIGNKYLSPEMRAKVEFEFSQSYNFTKSAEECQILWEFKGLFIWLKNTYQQDKFLKSVMSSFTFLTELHERYANQTCSEGASDEVPPLNGVQKYSTESKWPSTQNMFHYIFELYKAHVQKFLSSKLNLAQKTIREMCKAKDH